MGSFWGMNDAGKEAAGWPRELGAYDAEQMKQWLGKMNGWGDLGDYYTGTGADYWMNKMNGGYVPPDQIDAVGRQISPWVQDFVNNARDRRSQISDQEGGRRSAEDYAGEMSGRLDEQGARIGQNYDDIQNEINGTAGRQFGREDTTSNDIVSNIKNSSASMRGAVNDTFGGLRGDNAKTYAGIKGSGEKAFADQVKELALIQPGGQAQGARVARSFAPQVADTMMRLRRAGIDPNSPEAQSMLRNVESQRSRAMDDASADATLSYVDRKNDVSNKQLGFMTAADRARLENEMGLATGQVDRSNAITGNEANSFNQERRINAANMNAIDQGRSERTVANTDSSFGRGQELLDKRNALTGWGRDANMQDIDRRKANLEGDSASEYLSGQTLDNRYNRGAAWQGMDQATRDQGAANVTNLGRQYRNDQFQAANTGRQFGQDAASAYNMAYEREAPKAGWGAKLLGGIASTALGFIPGMSTGAQMLRGIGGQLAGGLGGSQGAYGGGGRGGGGGWGNGQFGGGYQGNGVFSVNPMIYQMPSPMPAASMPTPYRNTRTLPNGDFQVSTQRQPW